ncbi:MAG TPA: sulfotransferase domain-containing protein [Trueperaceae bacterium]
MFVLANGAYKSGSTWLLTILTELKKFEEIPAPYRKQVFRQAWVDPARLEEFLESRCHHDHDYVSKGHYGGKRVRELLLSHEDVVVFDITRNLPDTVVSHYYHFTRMYRVDWSFRKYYWLVGRYKAFEVRRYHETWKEPHPNVYVSSFESLKRDFAGEVRRIAAVLSLEPDDEEIARIKEATSLSSMRARRGKAGAERFFRKGEIGDWQAHFDERMLADVQRIERYGLPPLDRAVYALLFDLRTSVRAWARKTMAVRSKSRTAAAKATEIG